MAALKDIKKQYNLKPITTGAIHDGCPNITPFITVSEIEKTKVLISKEQPELLQFKEFKKFTTDT